MGLAVKVLAPLQESYVRLRLRETTQRNDSLSSNQRVLTHGPVEQSGDPVNGAAMQASYGCHIYDLSFDQLNARVRCKQTDFEHPVVFAHSEPVEWQPSVRLGFHGSRLPW